MRSLPLCSIASRVCVCERDGEFLLMSYIRSKSEPKKKCPDNVIRNKVNMGDCLWWSLIIYWLLVGCDVLVLFYIKSLHRKKKKFSLSFFSLLVFLHLYGYIYYFFLLHTPCRHTHARIVNSELPTHRWTALLLCLRCCAAPSRVPRLWRAPSRRTRRGTCT